MLKESFPSLETGLENLLAVGRALEWANGVMTGKTACRESPFMFDAHTLVSGTAPCFLLAKSSFATFHYVEYELACGTK